MNKVVSPADDLPARPSHRAMAQAAEWYALLKSNDANESEQVRWQAWLAHDPENRLAWRYVESISNCFAPLQATPDPRLGCWKPITG